MTPQTIIIAVIIAFELGRRYGKHRAQKKILEIIDKAIEDKKQ